MALTNDVTKLKNASNQRVSQLNINNKTYEIWDDTARLAIAEIDNNLNTLTSDSGGKFNEVIPKVNQIYKELTDYANSAEDGLVDSIIDTLFNKFDGDKANHAKYADVAGKIGTGTVGSATRPVYINNGVPTQVTYTAASGGPTADGETTNLSHGSEFVVPHVAQAVGGQVTVGNKTFKLPTCLTTSIATAANTDTSKITLGYGSKYKLTAGDTAFIFTTPAATTWSTLDGKPSTFAPTIGNGATEAAAGNHTHTTTLATSTGTSALDLVHGGKYQLTAGGNSFIFQMPAATTWSSLDGKPSTFAPTIGNGATEAAAGNHTHDATLAKDSTTTNADVDLASATKYKLTAGGDSVTFKMPSLLTIGTTATTAAPGNHIHDASLATDSTTSPDVNFAHGSTYKLTAGGDSVTFKMPAATTWSTITGKPDTFTPTIGSTATTAAAGNHTHATTLATDSGTASITLASAGKYKLTAGGKSVTFAMPTLLEVGTTATTAAPGNHTHDASIAIDSSNTNADVDFAHGTKYKLTAGGDSVTFKMPAATTWSTITGKPDTFTPTIGSTATTAAAGNHTHETKIATSTGTSALNLAHGSKYQLTAGGSSFIFQMPAATTWSNLSGKPALATVATSGSYNDLTNKPTIPTVNNEKLTINAGNSTKVEFTANQSNAVTKTVSLYVADEPDQDNGYTLTLGIQFT